MRCLFITFLLSLSFTASATNIVIEYDRNEKSTKIGFFDKTERIPTADNPSLTLGDARRYVLEFASQMVESQVHSEAKIFIKVKFDNSGGFSARTASYAYTHSEYSNYDEFGILKDGVRYPYIIRRILQNDSRSEYRHGEDSEISFVETAYNHDGFYDLRKQELPRFLTLVLHELVHALGFVGAPCFAGYCTQEQSDLPTVISPHIYADAPYDKYWRDLTKAEREEVAKEDDKLFYYGDDSLNSYILENVIGGHNTQGIMLHSGLASNGYVSSQSISHISAHVETIELMKSSVGDTTSLGAAAYILCDIGWCRDKRGWVTDFELFYSSFDKIEPNEQVYLTYTLNNSSDKALSDMFIEFDVQNAELTDENLLPEFCNITESIIICNLGVLEPHQQVDLELPFRAAKGTYPVFAKAYSESFVVDIDGFNNVNIQQVQVGDIPFPDVSLTNEFAVTEGEVFSTSPEFKANDSLSFDWMVVDNNDLEIQLNQISETGEVTFTAPSVEADTIISLNLIVNFNSTQQSYDVKVTIVAKTGTDGSSNDGSSSSNNQEVEHTHKQDEKSGGSMSYVAFLFLSLITVVRKKLKK